MVKYTELQTTLLNKLKAGTANKDDKGNITKLLKKAVYQRDPELQELLPFIKKYYRTNGWTTDDLINKVETDRTHTLSDEQKGLLEEALHEKISYRADADKTPKATRTSSSSSSSGAKSQFDKFMEKEGYTDENEAREAYNKSLSSSSSSGPVPKRGIGPYPGTSGAGGGMSKSKKSKMSEEQYDQIYDDFVKRFGDMKMKDDEQKTSQKKKKQASLIDTSSQLYKENKAMIDGVMAGMSEKNRANGNWLPVLASLEFPQIQILQQLFKGTPLGFNEDDNANLDKLLDNDGSLSTEDFFKTFAKMLVNPDAMGRMIGGRLSQQADEASKAVGEFMRKVKGEKKEETKNDLQSTAEERVRERQDETKASNERQKAIEKAQGREEQEGSSMFGSIRPVVNGKTPEKAQKPTADTYLKKPNAEDYGYKEPTAMDDFGRFMRKLLPLGPQIDITTPEEYISYIKRYEPVKYTQYKSKLDEYERRLKKTSINSSDEIDTSIDKDVLQAFYDTMNKVMGQGRMNGVDSERIGLLYDNNRIIKDVINGKINMSYENYQKLTQRMMNTLPTELRTANSNLWDGYNDLLTDRYGSKFEGDSELLKPIKYTSTSSPEDDPHPTRTETYTDDDTRPDDKEPPKPDDREPPNYKPDEPPTPDESGISQKQIQPSNLNVAGQLRPRLQWGDSDKDLTPTKEQVNTMNTIADAMSLDEEGFGNGRNNSLFNVNNIVDNMRYTNTFAMPNPPAPKPRGLPIQFIEAQRPVFNTQYASCTDGFRYSRNPYLFGQYQKLEPNTLLTPFSSQIINSRVNDFPAEIDRRTGGLEQIVSPNFDFVMNSRFVKSR